MQIILRFILVVSILFIVGQAYSQTTIWSEDFEGYNDGDTVALDNNSANSSPDWSYGPGSQVNKVFATQPINGNLSFYHRQGTSTWTTEVIDISSFTNVSITLNIKEQTCEANDKMETFYSIDGGTPIEFGDGNGDGNFNSAVNTVNNLSGSTLELSILTVSDAIDDKHKFDDIVIEGIVSTPGTDVVTACDSFTWINGTTYTASNNTATDTLTNSQGGDSIVTLNLTILSSTFGVDTVVACDEYTWINGVTYTSSNNTATDTLTNVSGCDSIITLNLTINSSPDASITLNGSSIEAVNTTANYQWLDCNANYAILNGETGQQFNSTMDGNYAVEVSENGCADTSACQEIIYWEIEENSLHKRFDVFPNPNNGQFNVTFKQNQSHAQITVYDLMGRQVSHAKYSNTKGIHAELKAPEGCYIVEVTDGKGQSASLRILKK